MRPITIALILLNIPLLLGAQDSELSDAKVTISYQELKELLKASGHGSDSHPETLPPVKCSLTAARYRLDLSTGIPRLTAEFETATFIDDWHRVSLLGGSSILESSETSSPQCSVINHDNEYVMLVKGAGTFAAKVSLACPNPEDWQRGGGFSLSPAPAAVGELRVVGLPKGKTIRVDGIASSRTDNGELVFALPINKVALYLIFEDAVSNEPQALEPSEWGVSSEILVRYREGRLCYSALVLAQADAGSGLSATFVLPQNVTGVTVEGEDLANWSLAPRDSGPRLLRLEWKTRDVLDRNMHVNWEVPQSALADEWILTPLRVHESPVVNPSLPARLSRSLFAFVAVDGLELSHPSLAKGVESRRLPVWLREQLETEDSLTAEVSGDTPLTLSASWLPRVETAQATVSLAQFETRLVADGSMLVTANYTVQHTAPINWTIDLPLIDQILTCEINQQPSNPIRRGENQIEFRLAPPDPSENETPSTKVLVSYSIKADVLDRVSGKVALELPLTELFIHRLDWVLALPAGYEPTAVEGNVEIAPAQTGSSAAANHIHLEKELCRGERPAVEIHYQSKGLFTES
jgi:hypothetical protein